MATTGYLWDFGDGNTSIEKNPVHTYQLPGVYLVTLYIYDTVCGTLIVEKYVYVYDENFIIDDANVAKTNKSYRLPVLAGDGFGVSEYADGDNPGFDWVWPECVYGSAICHDEEGNEIGLVVDSKTQKVLRVNNPDVWQDRYDAQYGGNRIIWEPWRKEDHAVQGEHVAIVQNEVHTYFKPYDRDKRNTSGYDSIGYPEDFRVDIAFHVNGEPETPKVTARRVSKDGDIVAPGTIEARTIQQRPKCYGAPAYLTGIRVDYDTTDKAAKPSFRTTSENAYQANLTSLPLFHVTRNVTPLLNLATGNECTGTAGSLITGPDNASQSAIQFNAPNFGMSDALPENISGDFTISAWFRNVLAFPVTLFETTAGLQVRIIAGPRIQVSDGINPVMTADMNTLTVPWFLVSVVRSGGTLSIYLNGSLIYSTALASIENYGDDLEIANDAAMAVFDVFAVPRAVGAAELEYYYTDITNNEGKTILIPF